MYAETQWGINKYALQRVNTVLVVNKQGMLRTINVHFPKVCCCPKEFSIHLTALENVFESGIFSQFVYSLLIYESSLNLIAAQSVGNRSRVTFRCSLRGTRKHKTEYN